MVRRPRGRRDLHGRTDPQLGPGHGHRSRRVARSGTGRRLHRHVPARHARTRPGERPRRTGRGRARRRIRTGSATGRDGTATVTPGVSDDAIRAIAHPGRRTMLRLVWDDERPATELADAAGMSKSAASQHLKLLRDAGLVTVRVDANRRLYRADLQRVGEIASFLDEFWATPLQRLRATAESIAT